MHRLGGRGRNKNRHFLQSRFVQKFGLKLQTYILIWCCSCFQGLYESSLKQSHVFAKVSDFTSGVCKDTRQIWFPSWKILWCWLLMMLVLVLSIVEMMTMMIALTMFSLVSQWDLTCFFTALHANRWHQERRCWRRTFCCEIFKIFKIYEVGPNSLNMA